MRTWDATRGALTPGSLTSGSASKSAAMSLWLGRAALSASSSCSATVGSHSCASPSAQQPRDGAHVLRRWSSRGRMWHRCCADLPPADHAQAASMHNTDQLMGTDSSTQPGQQI